MANPIVKQKLSALHSKIWKIARDLRGNSIGWDFKQYILGILFYRFISENLCAYINEIQRKSGESKFNYASLKDSNADRFRKSVLKDNGYFILPSELFENVRKQAKGNAKLNESLKNVFKILKHRLTEPRVKE